MKPAILGMLAETPVHPGAGRGIGVVDLPVAREAGTDYPVVVGSSLKGALRDKVERCESIAGRADALFGERDRAGDLLVADARLLLLPVRSLTSAYKWVTCPHLIERYVRDLRRTGLAPVAEPPAVERGKALAQGDDRLFLEERQFDVAGQPPVDVVNAIKRLLLHRKTASRVAGQLAVLNDDDFSWFVRYGLPVQARNVLDDKTKQSKNLWYEETLPPDTVMYALLIGRCGEVMDCLEACFPEDDPYLQVGGNETVGQGWFAVRARRPDASTEPVA